MKKSILSLTILASMIFSSQALADSITGNFQAAAQLNATCFIQSISNIPLNFSPTADPIAVVAQRPVLVRCSNLLPYSISINGGLSGNIMDRAMNSSTTSDSVHYNLYTDTNRTILFGDGTNGTIVNEIGSGGSHPTMIYARLYSNQYVAPGNYADTLTLTVNY